MVLRYTKRALMATLSQIMGHCKRVIFCCTQNNYVYIKEYKKKIEDMTGNAVFFLGCIPNLVYVCSMIKFSFIFYLHRLLLHLLFLLSLSSSPSNSTSPLPLLVTLHVQHFHLHQQGSFVIIFRVVFIGLFRSVYRKKHWWPIR